MTMKALAVLLADVVDGADIGMVQGGCGLRFTPKSLQSLAVLGHILRKKLQGDESAQAGVFGFIDHAHATAAEFFDNAIVRDGLIEQAKWSVPSGGSNATGMRMRSQRDQ